MLPRVVIYQHPLAYLVALEGVALLRAFSGAHDREFTLARLAEIRLLLDLAEGFGDGVEARLITTQEGYAQWAPLYDEPGNQLLEIEQPIVRRIIDGLPAGDALDAACGTGRHAAYLAARGHRVIGVDSSPDMLAVARRKVPEGEFLDGELDELPLADASVDLAVCAIALSHVEDIRPVFAELARVLRPNGDLIVSDSRGFIGDIGLPLVRVLGDGTIGYMPTWARLASGYLEAALPVGLCVIRCEEPRRPSPIVRDETTGSDLGVSGGPPNIWALHPYCADAANAAWAGNPAAIVWHFTLTSPP
jgi:ubiquinone/menaquinone biosynthesis C-methylase UbiE